MKQLEVPTGTIDRSRGDLHPAGNPHYWLDPENGRKVAIAVEARLEQLDPADAATFKANLATFESNLTAHEAKWTAAMAPLKGSNIIGYHSTFDYFLAAYGMPIVGFVEPKPGIPPTPAHTLELQNLAKSAAVKFVVIEPFHNPQDAAPIANVSSAKILVLPSSVGGASGVATYTDLFDNIVASFTK